MYIYAENLWKTYRNSLGQVDREVLKGLNLNVDKGEKVAIMGPSGSGKTTLLNLLGTLDTPDKGNISIGGQLVSGMTTSEILLFRNKTAGFVFQFHHLLPQCTLWENVLLPTIPHNKKDDAVYRRAEDLLYYMDVWEQRHHKPGELSGGECQRAAVARALINQPDLLLADEPTGSLDKKNADMLIDLLININKEMSITLIIATHSHAIAEKMDKVYEMGAGVLDV